MLEIPTDARAKAAIAAAKEARSRAVFRTWNWFFHLRR